MGEFLPTQRGVAVGGLVKESHGNTMAASKNHDPLLFFINFESRLQYSFLTSTTVGTMEVIRVFNNGFTGGKIFLSSCL